MQTRRAFLKTAAAATALPAMSHLFPKQDHAGKIMTVLGPINPRRLGTTLIHEHLLVDFIGAAEISPSRWNVDQVVQTMLPYLKDLKATGCTSFVDCTPNYLGRDAHVLRALAMQSGLNILTNTGYYGGSDNKFLPAHTFTESADQLAQRWVAEYNKGIDGSNVFPGFIKISVNSGPLSAVSQKLITAAAITHKSTGLTIASHTGPSVPAMEQVEILKQHKVDPSAFIWVHAQNEKDHTNHVKLARMGAWVSLDGLSDSNVDEYIDMMLMMKKEKCLHRTLISHDAGWYDPAKPGGGTVRPFTTLFTKFIPAAQKKGLLQNDMNQLLVTNAADAFTLKIKSAPSRK